MCIPNFLCIPLHLCTYTHAIGKVCVYVYKDTEKGGWVYIWWVREGDVSDFFQFCIEQFTTICIFSTT